MNVKRFNSSLELFQFVTDYFLSAAQIAINKNEKFNVAISGGTTPTPLFRILATRKNLLDWSKVNFFWVDERWVPESHPENNYGEAMRSGLNVLPANFFPFDTSMESPAVSSKALSQQIIKVLNNQGFDLTLLGAGIDGHTASIFESDLNDAKKDEVAFVTSHPQTGQVRLSLTLPTITKSDETLVILLGEEKRMLLEGILHYVEPHSPIQFAIFDSLNSIILTDICG